ncbi:MAG: hypothetical protein II922_08890 [Succinimonas sp.]|nr:hypothetical protein [Succinimonas sp.]
MYTSSNSNFSDYSDFDDLCQDAGRGCDGEACGSGTRKKGGRKSFHVSYAVFSYLRDRHFSRKASHALLGEISDDGSKWTLRGCIRNGFYRRRLSRQMRNSFCSSRAADSRFQA